MTIVPLRSIHSLTNLTTASSTTSNGRLFIIIRIYELIFFEGICGNTLTDATHFRHFRDLFWSSSTWVRVPEHLLSRGSEKEELGLCCIIIHIYKAHSSWTFGPGPGPGLGLWGFREDFFDSFFFSSWRGFGNSGVVVIMWVVVVVLMMFWDVFVFMGTKTTTHF